MIFKKINNKFLRRRKLWFSTPENRTEFGFVVFVLLCRALRGILGKTFHTELASEANGDGHLLNIFMEGEEVLPDYEGGVVYHQMDPQSRGVEIVAVLELYKTV